MSENRVFVDTNIIVYAMDSAAGSRQEVADARLVELWESGKGVISTQVLQEFYSVATSKLSEPLTADGIRIENPFLKTMQTK